MYNRTYWTLQLKIEKNSLVAEGEIETKGFTKSLMIFIPFLDGEVSFEIFGPKEKTWESGSIRGGRRTTMPIEKDLPEGARFRITLSKENDNDKEFKMLFLQEKE